MVVCELLVGMALPKALLRPQARLLGLQNEDTAAALLASPGDLFAQPPAAFYRLPEFELRGSSLLTRGCRRVLEFGPEKICLDMGSFTVTFYGAALQIESLTGKSLILTGKIRRIDFANKWGEEP